MAPKRFISVLILSALTLGGCIQPGCSANGEPAAVRATIAQRFPMTLGGVPISIQIAISGPEQEKGLMYRTELADGEGMLFVYKSPQRMNFWMNHVPIPLAIGFIDPDGTLNEIRHMLPNDTRTTTSSGTNLQFCLEMDDGWYERHGVRPGAKLDLTLLAAALKARGEDSADYGL
ncbi:MAG TPA: DUF192 domain-containing protein [Opitutales bacterium]|nr:DUF192 domain-containing protein [Opitutales bacterium]